MKKKYIYSYLYIMKSFFKEGTFEITPAAKIYLREQVEKRHNDAYENILNQQLIKAVNAQKLLDQKDNDKRKKD